MFRLSFLLPISARTLVVAVSPFSSSSLSGVPTLPGSSRLFPIFQEANIGPRHIVIRFPPFCVSSREFSCFTVAFWVARAAKQNLSPLPRFFPPQLTEGMIQTSRSVSSIIPVFSFCLEVVTYLITGLRMRRGVCALLLRPRCIPPVPVLMCILSPVVLNSSFPTLFPLTIWSLFFHDV